MTLSRLTLDANAANGTLPLDVKSGSLTYDESHAPFAAATIVLPYDDAVADLLDPRTAQRVQVILTQRFSGSLTLADLTAMYGAGGVSVSELSTAYTGLTLANLSVMYGEAWNAFGFRPSLRTAADLTVRNRVVDHLAGTVTVTLASDEALLQDLGLLSSTAVNPGDLTVLSCVQLALGTILGTYSLVTTDGAQTITADAATWQPGVSAWDYLTPITASAGLRLWCDEQRVWHLAAPASILAPGSTALAATGTVKRASDTIARDGSDWFDSVVVTYTWTDSSNVRHVQHDVAAVEHPTLTQHIDHDTPFPRAGEAAARLRKVQGHGRVLSIDAVADPSVYPAQPATLTIPDTPTQSGYVQAVTWSVPDDEMSVTTRELIDTPPTAWAFGAAGQSWNDVPVGMTWNTFDWTGVAP